MSAATDSLLRPRHGGRWVPEDFPEEAVGFRLVRVVEPGERLRAYESFRWPNGRVGMSQFLAQLMLGAEGFATDDYALADVLDDGHNIVAEFGIADAASFRRLQSKLRARVVSTDGDSQPETSREEP